MHSRFNPNEASIIDTLRNFALTCCQGQPAFSLSVKTVWKNYWGTEEEILLYAQIDEKSGEIPPGAEWAALRVEPVRAFLFSEKTDKSLFREVLALNNLSKPTRPPGIWALLHAGVRDKFAIFSQPPGLIVSPSLPNTDEPNLSVLPFSADLPDLFRQAYSVVQEHQQVLIPHWGLLVAGGNLETCKEMTANAHRKYAFRRPEDTTADDTPINPDSLKALAQIRNQLSAGAGRPQVLTLSTGLKWQQFQDPTIEARIETHYSEFPAHAAVTHTPVLTDISDRLAADTRLVYDPAVGLIAAGDSAQEAAFRLNVFRHLVDDLLLTSIENQALHLSSEEQKAAVEWLARAEPTPAAYAGEVAIVTGAASGIGKACAASLLARGCAVVGLDINPVIGEVFNSPSYLGLVCDITDEQTVRASIHRTVQKFGGLDILILNAGLFPGGCHIEKMSMNEFCRVVDVNLNANVVLMREAFPFLRLAPRCGRVVIIGSKNVKAPGPGAAAYSSSKAAVTQLARVAALEWGSERIRVNVLHPDAVFDTALYTEEVLQARAAHYGMTVEQYKKRNLLKAEITSHAVGEMAAEMCGPLFQCITGAQIQMDGGNDRTI